MNSPVIAAANAADLSADVDTNDADVNGIARGRKSWLSGMFNKAADIAGRAAVTNAIKITAVSAVAGAGASAFTTLAVAAGATGIGAALYTYGKDTFSAWRAARAAKDDSFKFIDTDRLKKARTALLFGVAGGAFGAWLAGTETFQHGLELAKTYGGKMIESAIGMFAGNVHAEVTPVVIPNAVPALPAMTGEEMTAHVNASHAAVLDANAPKTLPGVVNIDTAPTAPAALSEDDIMARIDQAHGLLDAERQGMEIILPEEPKNALGKLWDAAMQSEQAKGVFMAQMLKADPDNLNSVTPQFLKDRAHDVLRLTDLPWQERLSLARELAEEAQERGNRQAAGFLRDLAKLEDGSWKPRGLNIDGTGADVKTAPVAKPAVQMPVAEKLPQEIIPEQAPVKTVIVDTDPATGELREQIVDAAQGEALKIETITDTPAADPVTSKPAAQFERAAICTVKSAGDLSAAETFCEVSKPTMQPGDYISFVAADNVRINVSTSLLGGSVDVPTQDFLHEKVIGDGVSRLNQSVQAKAPAMR